MFPATGTKLSTLLNGEICPSYGFGPGQMRLFQAAPGHSPVVRADQRPFPVGSSDMPCPNLIVLESKRFNSSSTSFSMLVIFSPENGSRIFKIQPQRLVLLSFLYQKCSSEDLLLLHFCLFRIYFFHYFGGLWGFWSFIFTVLRYLYLAGSDRWIY